MKKILKFFPAVFAAVALVVATSLSWLAIENPVDFPDSFSGSTRVSYFAGGDGSKNDPYLITTRTHMYNLAWLQYLGYFNLGGYINNGRAQSFFKLAFDGDGLDMQGLALPPIGTKEYPFIGNFNGNGKVVYNFIVSNTRNTAKNTDYNLKVYPRGARFDINDVLTTTGTVTDTSTRAQVDIMGMFGVAGDLTLNASGDSFVSSYYTKSDLNKHQYGEDGKTLIPIPETNADGTAFNTAANDFYYSGMKISGFYIDRVKVNSESAKSLVGILAGYICSSVQNTGVYRSKISVAAETSGGVTELFDSTKNQRSYDTVVSKYSLVGDYDEKLVGWSEDPAVGDGEQPGGWGGSIDMRTLARRMNYIMTESGKTLDATADDSIQITANKIDATGSLALINNSTYNFKARVGTSGTITGLQFDYTTYNAVGIAAVNIYAGLVGDSYMPLNVDLAVMGLNDETNDKKSVTVYKYAAPATPYKRSYGEGDIKTFNWNINDKYKGRTTGEELKSSNAGYIVGMNASTGSIPLGQVNVEMRNLGSYLSKSVGSEYNNATLELQKVDKDGRKPIYDMLNAGLSTEGPNYETILLDPNKYKKMREKTGSQSLSNFLGGNNKLLYGMYFQNSQASNYALENITNYSKIKNAQVNGTEFADYEVIPGAINFSTKTAGVVSSIWGTMSSASANHKGAFDIYKVERNGNNEISSVTKIEKIYKNNNQYVINPASSGGDCVYDESWFAEGKLAAGYAYYIEIPLPAGDYAIGMKYSSKSTAARIMYLDIGADGDDGSGGSGETQTLPYLMESVDFVSMSATDTSDTLSVPSGGYPSYNDVGFKLGGDGASAINDEVFFKREKHSADVTGDINTTVYYWRQNMNLVCTLVPSDSPLGAEDETKASW